jgi:DNA-directed RNA polymerase alpha subunit
MNNKIVALKDFQPSQNYEKSLLEQHRKITLKLFDIDEESYIQHMQYLFSASLRTERVNSIMNLPLSTPTINALMRAKIYTIQQIPRNKKQLMKIKHIGPISADDILEALSYLS